MMLTKYLSDFALSITFESLPPDVAELTKFCIQDLMGVVIAGSASKQASIWKEYFAGHPRDNCASGWYTNFPSLNYRDAAALNSAVGHIMDFDDVHSASITHLGVVTIPSAIAIGQKYKKTGREIIAAIAAGYEVGARIGEAVNPGSYWYWHTTGIVGGFCSCMAAGKLLGLNAGQMLNALGSAGTQSSGLWEFINDGAMSKPLHTANATLCGIRSAELAMLGLTGAGRILEGEQGLIKAITSSYNMDALTNGLGTAPYKIKSNSFKPYSCCRHTHSAVYCADLMMECHQINPLRIVRITDRTYQIAKTHTDNPNPTTPYGYKFSLQYCIAAVIVYRRLHEPEFSEEKTENQLVRRLMDKVEVIVDEKFEKEFQQSPDKWIHQVAITMEDGSVFTRRVDYPLGDWHNPFDWSIADEKFYTITHDIISDKQAETLTNNIKKLEQLDNINELFAF